MFNNRSLFVLIMALLTLLLGYMAVTRLELRPSFEKMIPQSQPYIQNFLENRTSLRGLGNSVRVVVENTEGDIFDPEYLDVVREVNDILFATPGVDRAWMKSLWSPRCAGLKSPRKVSRWCGHPGYPGAPGGYRTDQAEHRPRRHRWQPGGQRLQIEHDRRAIAGQTSATGQGINYYEFSKVLEEKLRDKYEFQGDSAARRAGEEGTGKYKIRVIGFAKLIGDLIDGLIQVMMFFGLAVISAFVIILLYTRCLRSTLLVIGCSLTAVIWQLGIVSLVGLRHRPLFDPGAVPDFRHRRVPSPPRK